MKLESLRARVKTGDEGVSWGICCSLILLITLCWPCFCYMCCITLCKSGDLSQQSLKEDEENLGNVQVINIK